MVTELGGACRVGWFPAVVAFFCVNKWLKNAVKESLTEVVRFLFLHNYLKYI